MNDEILNLIIVMLNGREKNGAATQIVTKFNYGSIN